MQRRILTAAGLAALAGLTSGAGYWLWNFFSGDKPKGRQIDELGAQSASRQLVQPAPPGTRLLGWNVNWVEQDRLRRALPGLWRQFRQLGANATRDVSEWAWLQRGPGSPFAKDSHVQAAEGLISAEYKPASVESLRLLCCGNAAFWTGEDVPSPERFTQFANGFAAYVSQVINDQPEARVFEVWNEWNLTQKFNGNELIRRGPLYARLFVHTAAHIRRRRAGALVITQGLGISKEAGGLPDNEFLIGTLNYPGVLQSADGIGLHPYFFKLNGSPERLAGYLVFTRRQLLEQVKGYAQRSLPFYITETGFPTAEKSSLSLGSRWGYGIDENLQAAFLARMAILCMALPYVHALMFHNLVDSGSDKAELEHNFGLLRSDLSPKAAWHGMKALVPALIKATEFEWLAGMPMRAATVKEALETSPEPIQAVRFGLGTAESRWCTAIWTTSDKPRSVGVDAGGASASLEICLREFGRDPRPVNANAQGIFTIQIGASPIYVMQTSIAKPVALRLSS